MEERAWLCSNTLRGLAEPLPELPRGPIQHLYLLQTLRVSLGLSGPA